MNTLNLAVADHWEHVEQTREVQEQGFAGCGLGDVSVCIVSDKMNEEESEFYQVVRGGGGGED